jgi:hypothetical protein
VAYGDPEEAYLFITPVMYLAKEIGEIFTLGVNISGVNNLVSLEFIMTYNASLLDITHVVQGDFFPPPPKSCFQFEKNESFGFVKVNMSLAKSETPRSGNGTLALIGFKVVKGQISCLSSTFELEQVLLLDSASNPIAHDLVGAVYFWKSMQPDPPVGGRLLDLYTNKGGIGPDEPGGFFVTNELVYLFSSVMYNGYPVQRALVAFEILNPFDEIIAIRTVVADENGVASISFRVPNLPSSNGTWTAISTVDIADKVIWDTISFQVYFEGPPSALNVSISPMSALIIVGQSVTFTSTVSGGYPPYTYQWYLDGNPVSGATSDTWTFTSISSGTYYVCLKVTDDKGDTAQSNYARVVVVTVPLGGHSIPIQVQTKEEPIIVYIALTAVLTAAFTKLRQKAKRNC